jgi:hypothetical protein
MKTKVPLFPLGRTIATPGALHALARTGTSPASLLDRHACRNWGQVGLGDWEANERDLVDGECLLSVYQLEEGTRLYCITEWDRSVTTLLRVEEY